MRNIAVRFGMLMALALAVLNANADPSPGFPGNPTSPNLLNQQVLGTNTQVQVSVQKPLILNPKGEVSGPICGGVYASGPQKGTLQPPCPPVAATYERPATQACPAGSFFDLGRGECWSCPSGYDRSAAAVDSDRACSKLDKAQTGAYGPAKLVTTLCQNDPNGKYWSFYDPIRGGECRSCPTGYKRSMAPVDADNACYIPGDSYTRGVYLKEDCEKKHGRGNCDGSMLTWSPKPKSGYSCVGIICGRPERQAQASHVGSGVCPAGEIQDAYDPDPSRNITNTRHTCWQCSPSWDRTVFPVNGNKACQQPNAYAFTKATHIDTLFCSEGQVFDPYNKDNRGNVVGKSGGTGGTCWSCPAGYSRSTAPVYGNQACKTEDMVWGYAPYPQVGLFGLDGAEEVALALVRDGALIDTLINGYITFLQSHGQKTATVRGAIWQKIALMPQSSEFLKVAMLSRLENAMVHPNDPSVTAAEKRLLLSFTKELVRYRTYIAGNALAAYDNWESVTATIERLGGGALAKSGASKRVPPDYSLIVAASAVAGITATSNILTITEIGKNLRFSESMKLFPNSTLSWAKMELSTAQRALSSAKGELKLAQVMKSMGQDAKYAKYVGSGVIEGLEDAVKVTRASVVAAEAAVDASTGVLFLADIGPQILVGVALEIIIYEAEQLAKILNARPALLNKLADAQRPPNFVALLASSEDPNMVETWWATIVSGQSMPNNLQAFATAVGAKASASTGSTWQQVGKVSAVDVGAGAESAMWFLDNARRLAGGYGATMFDLTRTAGKPMDGAAAMRIDADAQGKTVVVTERGEIYRYGGPQATGASTWVKVPGMAKDIGIAANGAMWVIGTNASGAGGDFGVFRWNAQRNDWDATQGAAIRIDVDPQGNAWVVTNAGQVWRYTGSAWVNVPGVVARDVGVGANGAVFVAGKDGSVYKWNGKSWESRGGAKVTDITVTANGSPVVVIENREVYIGQP